MVFVVGAVDPEIMMNFIKEDQASKSFEKPQEIKRIFPNEQLSVDIQERTLQMDGQKPKVMFGIKSNNTNIFGNEMLNYELSMQVAVELIFGRTSVFYQDVYEKGYKKFMN